MAPRRDTLYRPRTGGSCRRAPVACGHHIRRKRAYATAFVSAGVKVRNVAGLSYTTSSALIFSSRRRFWASNSAIAALVDTGSLVYLIAALWCRSKDAAGEPQQGLVGKLAARVTTRRVTCPKRVVEGSPAASSKLALTGRTGRRCAWRAPRPSTRSGWSTSCTAASGARWSGSGMGSGRWRQSSRRRHETPWHAPCTIPVVGCTEATHMWALARPRNTAHR